MEYNFRTKNYKISGFKTYLTNQLKKQPIETIYQFLTEFIENNNFENVDMFSILDRYIDYSNRIGLDKEKIYDYVLLNLQKFPNQDAIENIIPLSNLYCKIKSDYALNFLNDNIGRVGDNTKEKVQVLLLKADILIEKKEFDKAFSVLRDCSNQSYDLYIFDSLELKRTIYQKMAKIGEMQNKSDVALTYYIYYCAFQASCEFLSFPYLDTYRNFRLDYSIVESPDDEIIQISQHILKNNIPLNLLNSFLQEIYRREIPKVFKVDNIDIYTFSILKSPIKELTYYSNYISNLSVPDLVSAIEMMTSSQIRELHKVDF